jgi:hypothetical protein
MFLAWRHFAFEWLYPYRVSEKEERVTGGDSFSKDRPIGPSWSSALRRPPAGTPSPSPRRYQPGARGAELRERPAGPWDDPCIQIFAKLPLNGYDPRKRVSKKRRTYSTDDSGQGMAYKKEIFDHGRSGPSQYPRCTQLLRRTRLFLRPKISL